MPTYRILGSEKFFSALPTRQGMVDRVVIYSGDDGVSRIVTVPDEGFSLQTAEAAIRKYEAERRLATPHTFNT